MTFAFTLPGLMLSCTLVLKYKSFLLSHDFLHVYSKAEDLRLELQFHLDLCRVQRHVHGAENDVKRHLIEEASIRYNQSTAARCWSDSVPPPVPLSPV